MANRNAVNHFMNVPTLSGSRSSFKRPSRNLLTLNIGELVPIYCDPVLPGDTFKIKTNKLFRLNTPVHPTMDTLYADTYFFFVPCRLVWEHWEQFCGASDNAWLDNVTYTIPTLEIPYSFTDQNFRSMFTGLTDDYCISPHSLLNYLGLPILKSVANSSNSMKINALPIRAYGLIYNEFFRDENLQDKIPVYTGDTNINLNNAVLGQTYFTDEYYGGSVNSSQYSRFNCFGSCCKVNQTADYFTSALPAPQKGQDVLIPADGYVSLTPKYITNSDLPGFVSMNKNSGSLSQLPIAGVSTGEVKTSNTSINLSGYVPTKILQGASAPNITQPALYNPGRTLGFDNLSITVNNLRLAIATQQYLELKARGGSRYTEILANEFRVYNPDARLQRPEYLGGERVPLNMSEIAQTSESANTPLGTLSGHSLTFHGEYSVSKSFTEHGFIIGLCCIRFKNIYSQGAERFWFKSDITDIYHPVFANLGEQPVYNREIFIDNSQDTNVNNPNFATTVNDSVFGYQEAWAEYRYKPDRVTGFASPVSPMSLASWHYAPAYAQTPTLSEGWLASSVGIYDDPVNRSLAVTSLASGFQVLADFAFDTISIREMPVYSVPGLQRM